MPPRVPILAYGAQMRHASHFSGSYSPSSTTMGYNGADLTLMQYHYATTDPAIGFLDADSFKPYDS